MSTTTQREPRRYTALFLRLLKAPNTVVTLHVPPVLHKRVAKAIRKERGIHGLTWAANDCYRLRFWSKDTILYCKFEALSGATAMQELSSLDLTHLVPKLKETTT